MLPLCRGPVKCYPDQARKLTKKAWALFMTGGQGCICLAVLCSQWVDMMFICSLPVGSLILRLCEGRERIRFIFRDRQRSKRPYRKGFAATKKDELSSREFHSVSLSYQGTLLQH